MAGDGNTPVIIMCDIGWEVCLSPGHARANGRSALWQQNGYCNSGDSRLEQRYR